MSTVADARVRPAARVGGRALRVSRDGRSCARSCSSRSSSPTVVVATAFVALLPEGHERGLLPILAAHVFFNVAIVVRLVGTAWARLDPRLWDAAATLGAGPWRRRTGVTLPLLAPALAALRRSSSSSASPRSA